MALTKERKNELLAQYRKWIAGSRAVFMSEYKGVNMKQLDDLRARLREVGGEYHVLKNTLMRLAFEEAGYEIHEDLFSGSTAVSFAFDDTPAAAKTLSDFANAVPFVKLKGGYLGKGYMKGPDVVALAELPPLPVLRAQLLGAIQAPASKLVRTLAEPGRGVAAAIRAYSEA